MIIAIDFDGTIVEHEFPEIGNPVPGAFRWMREFIDAGAKLILYTMRSDTDRSGDVLSQAVEFCRDNGIEFWGVNENPEQREWTSSPKVYAKIYIDDAAMGCPLKPSAKMGGRDYVDWDCVGPKVMEIINERKSR